MKVTREELCFQTCSMLCLLCAYLLMNKVLSTVVFASHQHLSGASLSNPHVDDFLISGLPYMGHRRCTLFLKWGEPIYGWIVVDISESYLDMSCNHMAGTR